ncbi:hypothetical protein N8135_02385, partial [Oceanospirillaceae bacterium]|nr:hypothetical protein [Oceanospirillaceae bacterium]
MCYYHAANPPAALHRHGFPPTSFTPLVGGAIFNTAIGLGRLGAEVGMVSGISNDLFGEQLHDA